MPLAPQSTAAAGVWVYIAMTVLHPVSVAAGHKVVQLPAAASRNFAAAAPAPAQPLAAAAGSDSLDGGDGEAAGTPTLDEQQRRLQSNLEIITSDVFAVTRLPSDACAADLTGDGDVFTDDLLLLLADFGRAQDPVADLDGDGRTGTDDVRPLLLRWPGLPAAPPLLLPISRQPDPDHLAGSLQLLLLLASFGTSSCAPMGCDGVRGSGLSLDACDVCDGDGQSCLATCGDADGLGPGIDAVTDADCGAGFLYDPSSSSASCVASGMIRRTAG